MKALTLHQPWASLIALGVKRIETRSWGTRYRGPLAIHAGRTPPEPSDLGYPLVDALGDLNWILTEPWTEEDQVAAGLPPDGDLIGFPLPLGAVVATCTLVDVVPMAKSGSGRQDRHVWLDPEFTMEAYLLTPDSTGPGGWAEPVNVTAQLPYGDFAPGRFAFLLDDVKPTTARCPACWHRALASGMNSYHADCPICDDRGRAEPVSARGRQGLWEWTP